MADTRTQYLAAKNSAVLFDLSDRGKLLCSGVENKAFLNSVVSAHIDTLADGAGTFATYLEPKGKYLADLKIFSVPQGLLIDCHPETDTFVYKEILKYKFRAKISLTNVTNDYSLLVLCGPKSDEIAQKCGILLPEQKALFAAEISEDSGKGWSARIDLDSLWIWAASDCKNDLFTCLQEAGATSADRAVYEILRVEAGIPEWGKDIDETIIPMEALQQRALSFSKCYPGQEVVSRIHFRGHVNKMLQLIYIDGDKLPPTGARLSAHEQDVGHLTTAIQNPVSGQILALGYIKRQAKIDRTPLAVKWDDCELSATSENLPYEPV